MPAPVELLQQVPLFSGLERGQLEQIAKSFKERTFSAGDSATTEGQGGVGFFVIEDGQATVTIGASDSVLRVAVADDGHGFDTAAVQESGLRGLRDRIEALGGHIEVESRPSGTRLHASLPAWNGSHA